MIKFIILNPKSIITKIFNKNLSKEINFYKIKSKTILFQLMIKEKGFKKVLIKKMLS